MRKPGFTDSKRSRNTSRMPVWIRQQLGMGERYGATRASVSNNGLHTVCEGARCPNRGECWSRGTATFMLLGETCTRACGFCSVATGRPLAVDQDEPMRVVRAVKELALRFVVLTSVNRDDQEDKGAGVFAATVRALRQMDNGIGIELLTPDFRGFQQQGVDLIRCTLNEVAFTGSAGPALIWGHNVETVPSLYRVVRKGSRYGRSLRLLELAGELQGVETKSALMLGLGETREQVVQVLRDLRNAGVSRVSMGQYLRPGTRCLPVAEYLTPGRFREYGEIARTIGFTWVMSGPLVRSSYHAEDRQDHAAVPLL